MFVFKSHFIQIKGHKKYLINITPPGVLLFSFLYALKRSMNNKLYKIINKI